MKLGLSPERARMRVERPNRLDVVLIRTELILGAIHLCRLHPLPSGMRWLLVGRAAGCGRLLSEDMQDGQSIDGVRIVNPFE